MAVWAEGVGGLVLLRTFHYEALGMSVAVDKDDGVACFQLREYYEQASQGCQLRRPC